MSDQRGAQRTRRTSRPQQRSWIVGPHDDELAGWQSFLSVESGLVGEPRFCNVLGSLRAREGDQKGTPWVVPVLGSGCLTGPSEEQRHLLGELPAKLAVALSRHDLPGGTQPRKLTWEMATSLIVDRIPEASDLTFAPPDLDDDPSADSLTEMAALVVLAAALLDRARHASLALRPSAHRPSAALPLSSNARGRLASRLEEIEVALVAPAQGCLAQAVRAGEKLRTAAQNNANDVDPVDVGAAIRVVQHVLRMSRADNLRAADVDAAIEVGWLLLIQKVRIYPGWKEFTTAASMRRGDAADGVQHGPESRRLRLGSVAEALTTLEGVVSLKNATKASWKRRDSPRSSFYASVVDVLQAQSRSGLGVATAFVTSMDVELEMALAERGQPFTVLVPYHFVYGSGDQWKHRAMLFWLAATVDPGDLDHSEGFDLRHAKVDWQVAPGAITDKSSIVIVRVVGSPLLPQATFKTPVAQTTRKVAQRTRKVSRTTLHGELALLASAAVLGPGRDPRDRVDEFMEKHPPQNLVPAFALDEYSGMHQMVSASHGLPRDLLHDRGNTNAPLLRYWLAVGVQIEDALVRMLLASYIDDGNTPDSRDRGDRDVEDPPQPPAEQPQENVERNGAMVNRRMSVAEADLLSWQGLAAVQAPYTAVTEHLEHYARHLRAEHDPQSPLRADGDDFTLGQSFVVGAPCEGVR